MVHALREIWRVLVPSGVLMDFRPIGDSWPLVIESSGQQRSVAIVDRAPHIRDDAVCDHAIAHVLREGWFIHERQQAFAFSAHWDAAAEVCAPVTIPDSVSAESQNLLVQMGTDARIGIRFENTIASYRKLPASAVLGTNT